MTERIKLTEDDLKDADGWEMHENEGLLILCDDVVQLKKQILDDNKKAPLFDSLLIENQQILDTISQVKIVNGILEQQLQSARNEVISHAAMCMSNKNKLSEIVTLWNVRPYGWGDKITRILKENS